MSSDTFVQGAALGGGSTLTQVAQYLFQARRGGLEATSRLRWECQENAGSYPNTGSLGAAGDLSIVGAGVTRRSLSPGSTLGPGIFLSGGATSYVRGAAGQTVGNGSAVSLWVVVIPHNLTVKQYVLARDYAAPGAWADPWLAASLAIGPAGLSVRVNSGGPGTGFEFDSGTLAVEKQYLLGLTYDSTTLRAWVNGLETGSMAGPGGAIGWGDPTARWHLGENDAGERSNSTVVRAGAEERVWDAARWAEEACRINGHPTTV